MTAVCGTEGFKNPTRCNYAMRISSRGGGSLHQEHPGHRPAVHQGRKIGRDPRRISMTLESLLKRRVPPLPAATERRHEDTAQTWSTRKHRLQGLPTVQG